MNFMLEAATGAAGIFDFDGLIIRNRRGELQIQRVLDAEIVRTRKAHRADRRLKPTAARRRSGRSR